MSLEEIPQRSRPLILSVPSSNAYCPQKPTLQEVLRNTAPPPWTLAAFMSYLSQNHCLETLEFTMDAQRYTTHYLALQYPEGQDRSYVIMLWQKLMDAYIQPNSPREINLPTTVRDDLLSLPYVDGPPRASELEPAVKIVYELMDESVLEPFINSVTSLQRTDSPWMESEAGELPDSSERRLDSRGLSYSSLHSPLVPSTKSSMVTPDISQGMARNSPAEGNSWKKIGEKLRWTKRRAVPMIDTDGLRYEDGARGSINRVGKKVAQFDGRAWKREIDEELLKEHKAANDGANQMAEEEGHAIDSKGQHLSLFFNDFVTNVGTTSTPVDDSYSQSSMDTNVSMVPGYTASIHPATSASSDIYGWEEEVDKAADVEHHKAPERRTNEPRLGDDIGGHQYKQQEVKRKSLLYRVLNLRKGHDSKDSKTLAPLSPLSRKFTTTSPADHLSLESVTEKAQSALSGSTGPNMSGNITDDISSTKPENSAKSADVASGPGSVLDIDEGFEDFVPQNFEPNIANFQLPSSSTRRTVASLAPGALFGEFPSSHYPGTTAQELLDFYAASTAAATLSLHQHDLDDEFKPLVYARHRRASNTSAISSPSTAPSTAQSISTIASLSSMSSTLGPEGAAERLIEVLLEDIVLRNLYKEALSRVTVERLERNLRRLFKLFAVELHREAVTAEQRGAATFVRKRARNSAHIICNTIGRVSEIGPRAANPGTAPKLTTKDILEDESDDNSDYDTRDDDLIGLEQLERFIVAANAFESLRLNLRQFIYPEAIQATDKMDYNSGTENLVPGGNIVTEAKSVEKDGFPVPYDQVPNTGKSDAKPTDEEFKDDRQLLSLTSSMEQEHMSREGDRASRQNNGTILTNVLLRLSSAAQMLWRWEPVVADGKERVRWKCKCGHFLYDDFTEMQTGAVERLQSSLNNQASSSNSGASSANNSGTSRTTMSSLIGASIRGLTNIFGKQEVDLPRHAAEPISMTQIPGIPAEPLPELLYLLLCYREGVYSTKLLQLPIADLVSDSQLFKALRSHYKSMRNQWWSFLSFRTLTSIRFVRFEMYKKSQSVDIRKKDDIPPADHIEYTYAPVPIDIIPPVGENQLMHFFHHPDHAEDEPACLDRFPKKLRERFAVCTGKATGTGWGLHLVEGWDAKKTWIICFVLFGLGSALWGILWTVFMKSAQDAFAVSAFMIAIAVLTIGFTQAMIENITG